MAYTTINKSTDHFNAQIWDGNDGSNRAMTTGFQPDWVWIKARDGTYDHHLYDAVRGATYALASNNTAAQATKTNGLKSFTSDGFTLGGDAGVNDVSLDYVGWSWKAGNSAGSSNTDGTTSSTVSANTTSGFSIVQHSGSGGATTIGHGLGVAPKIVLSKRTSGTNSWFFQQNIIGGSWTSSNYLILNTTAAAASSSSIVNNVSSSTISFAGGDDWVNASGSTYIHYVFAEKKGFSKFGKYNGNGSADGTFVYTGFKPAWIMLKDTNSGSAGWMMFDNKRLGYNVDNNALYPNANAAEGTGDDVDLLSNGFKARSTDAGINTSGNSYIYLAFAAAPFVGTNNIPANAR